MRPLISHLWSLWRDGVYNLSVDHILAQPAPGHQEAQCATEVQAGHDDHGGLQALRVNLATDLLQVLA